MDETQAAASRIESALPDPRPVPFWSTIYEFIGPYRRMLLLSTACALVVGVAVALQPMVIKWVVDAGILRPGAEGGYAPADERFRYALQYTGLYILLSAVRMGLWLYGSRYMIEAIERFLANLRARFFRHVQHLCFRFHDEVSSGELFNYIMGSPVQSLKTFLSQGSMMVPYMLVSWVVALGALFSFNATMTFITLGMITVVVAVNYRSRFRIRELSSDFMETESSVSKYVADMLRGCRAIKIYAMEDTVSYSFEFQVDRIRREGALLAMRQRVESMKPEALQYFGMAVLYAAGAWMCLYREMEVGTLFAFVNSVGILMGPLMTFLQLNLVRANAEAGLNRIVRILEVEKTTPELPPESRTRVSRQIRRAREEAEPAVVFEDVRFAYDETRPVFRSLCCRIPDGQSVALVGPSGSGKSTFVSLLLRLYDPQAGRVLLNGKDLKAYSLTELRACFGVVPQDPFIFQGTILDNLRVVRPEATEEEVRRAMEIAYVSEFVDAYPKGMHTPVGESGFSLSGGQRQRLAIARAVLADCRYFIFDEATAALDNQSEKRIQSAMERLTRGRTTFIIAHRLSTIRHVDRILVFENGRIVQDGAYEELARAEGLFRGLLRSAAAETSLPQ